MNGLLAKHLGSLVAIVTLVLGGAVLWGQMLERVDALERGLRNLAQQQRENTILLNRIDHRTQRLIVTVEEIKSDRKRERQ